MVQKLFCRNNGEHDLIYKGIISNGLWLFSTFSVSYITLLLRPNFYLKYHIGNILRKIILIDISGMLQYHFKVNTCGFYMVNNQLIIKAWV